MSDRPDIKAIRARFEKSKEINRDIHTWRSADIDALLAEVERLEGAAKWLDWLEYNSLDLRCLNVPTGGDDYDIEWIVIEHYMAAPHERVVSERGARTPLEAIESARAALTATTGSEG